MDPTDRVVLSMSAPFVPLLGQCLRLSGAVDVVTIATRCLCTLLTWGIQVEPKFVQAVGEFHHTPVSVPTLLSPSILSCCSFFHFSFFYSPSLLFFHPPLSFPSLLLPISPSSSSPSLLHRLIHPHHTAQVAVYCASCYEVAHFGLLTAS